MKMNALPSSEMNSRSPRVVVSVKTPRRTAPPGTKYSQMPMPTRQSAMKPKKRAVGQVQAIQLRSITRLPYTRPRAKPLAM
jgi:hypothetical protein